MRAVGEVLDPQALLGAGHLVAVHRRGQLLEVGGQRRGSGRAARRARRRTRRAPARRRCAPRRPRRRRRRAGRAPTAPPSATAWATAAARARRSRRSTARRRDDALVRGRPLQLLGTPGDGSGALLAGAHGQPRLHLGAPGRLGGERRLVACVRGGLGVVDGVGVGPVHPRGELGQGRACRRPGPARRPPASGRSARPRPVRPATAGPGCPAARRRRPSGRRTRAAGRAPRRRPGRPTPARCAARPARSAAARRRARRRRARCAPAPATR